MSTSSNNIIENLIVRKIWYLSIYITASSVKKTRMTSAYLILL